MTTYALRVDPDGSVLRYDEPCSDDMARVEFDGLTTVVRLRAPFLDSVHVGWLHDFGAVNGMPLNRKAWGLYGGSPCYGPMFVQRDDRGPLDPDLCLMVESSDFPAPSIITVMDAWLAGNDMRAQDQWPL